MLVIVSTLIFAFLLLIPFIDTTDKNKVFITTACVIVAEILFWTGSLLLGKQIIDKYKSYLNPRNWFKKKGGSDK